MEIKKEYKLFLLEFHDDFDIHEEYLIHFYKKLYQFFEIILLLILVPFGIWREGDPANVRASRLFMAVTIDG